MVVADANSGRAVYWGTGRRKNAVARVRLVPGTGQLTVNGKDGNLYFQFNANYLGVIKAPLVPTRPRQPPTFENRRLPDS